MDICRDRHCDHHDPEFLNACRVGDLFCLAVKGDQSVALEGPLQETFFHGSQPAGWEDVKTLVEIGPISATGKRFKTR